MNLTKNFSLTELTRSATAVARHIDNTPSDTVVVNLLALCRNVLQPLRNHVGGPVSITSGYRSPALNRAVGGVANSQHTLGEAADIHIPRIAGTQRPDLALAKEWMLYIAANLPYDQLILERTAAGAVWIHVSCRRDTRRNRRQMLTLTPR